MRFIYSIKDWCEISASNRGKAMAIGTCFITFLFALPSIIVAFIYDPIPVWQAPLEAFSLVVGLYIGSLLTLNFIFKWDHKKKSRK